MDSRKRYADVKEIMKREEATLNDISMKIWENPELAYKEVFAHQLLSDFLVSRGFKVKRHYCGLETSFRADFELETTSLTSGELKLAVLCEYDALPEIGHGCGHNLIAECGIGAALAIQEMMKKHPTMIRGKLVVIGTPAEEGGAGKVRLISAGGFSDIDMAMMAHPSTGNFAHPLKYLAVKRLEVDFKGVASHAANFPWDGINALDAVFACYSNISVYRQQMKPEWRVHMIVTKGGTVTNIIPEEAQMAISFRSIKTSELEELEKNVLKCIQAAALSTRCEYNVTEISAYKNVISNKIMATTYRKYAEMGGEVFVDDDPNQTTVTFGSTDMGDVTHIMPGIHPKFFVGEEVSCHSRKFTEVSRSEMAQPHTITAAIALAGTAIELMSDPEMVKEVQEEFVKSKVSCA